MSGSRQTKPYIRPPAGPDGGRRENTGRRHQTGLQPADHADVDILQRQPPHFPCVGTEEQIRQHVPNARRKYSPAFAGLSIETDTLAGRPPPPLGRPARQRPLDCIQVDRQRRQPTVRQDRLNPMQIGIQPPNRCSQSNTTSRWYGTDAARNDAPARRSHRHNPPRCRRYDRAGRSHGRRNQPRPAREHRSRRQTRRQQSGYVHLPTRPGAHMARLIAFR